MASHVDVEGSGEGITKITATGSASGQTGTVMGVAASELRFLTVENTGGQDSATAIYSPSRLLHVTAVASGGRFGNTAINSSNSLAPFSVEMNEVIAVASGPAYYNIALCICYQQPGTGSATLTLQQVSATASGGGILSAGIKRFLCLRLRRRLAAGHL